MKKAKEFIPVSQPVFNGNEKKYILEALDTGWISSEGPFVERFENNFSLKVNRKYGVAVSSGTAALDIAVKALGIREGDEVIMPTFTIISCVSAVINSGATPIFIDADPKNWNMQINDIEENITDRTKAIMAVHIYGLPVDMDPILEIANKFNLYVIEDAAQMHGQYYKESPCGSFGDISTFSFYANKHITTGEGGMLVTNNESLKNKCQLLRNLCFKEKQRFVHDEFGWNYRFTNIQAAIGLAQLERLDEIVQKKKLIGKWYNELFLNMPGITLPLEMTDYAKNIYWVYGLVLDGNVDANIITNRLNENGIGTRPFFYPMHKQPVLKTFIDYGSQQFPISERLAKQGFYLPSGLGLKQNDVERVAKELIQLLN